MTELAAWFAVLALAGVLVFLALTVRLNPRWLEDKPYIDKDGNEVPCGCRACGSEAS